MAPLSRLSTPEILEKLLNYRLETVRRPEEVVQLGEIVLERGWANSSSDEVWVVLEQLAVAAIECGKLDLAQVCASRLSDQFPKSPRVNILAGLLLEGRGALDEAREFYEDILALNESDVAIRKRLIALHLYSPPAAPSKSKAVSTSTSSSTSTALSKERGIELLVEHLDTIYSDAEGWAQLAAVYASLQLYPQSLSALSHLLLLAPHNPYHLLQHAETAYTIGDYPLAYKELLRVIEMSEGVTSKGGVGRRAAVGAKLCIARLSNGSASTTTEDPLLRPKSVKPVDLVVTKLVLDAYSVEGAVGVGVARKWLGATQG